METNETDKLNSRESLLFSIIALKESVEKTYGDSVEERIIENYHLDIEKAEQLFDYNLKEFKIKETDIEYENGGPIGFVESMTSTASVTTAFVSRKKYYNKILFLKKINELLLFLRKKTYKKAEKKEKIR